MKKHFIILCNTLILLMPPLAAAEVGKEEGGGLMVWLFMGFGALIIVFQVIPGLALFAVMLKEIFSRASAKVQVTAAAKVKGKLYR